MPFLVAALLVLSIARVGDFADGFEKIRLFVGLKKDALDLAKDDAKARLSRDFTRVAWRRLLWMERYASAVERALPTDVQKDSWNTYVKALDDWNADLMVNYVLMSEYYGSAKRNALEWNIQPRFVELNLCLTELRYEALKLDFNCPYREGSTVRDRARNLGKKLADLRGDLYCFVTDLPRTTEEQCIDLTTYKIMVPEAIPDAAVKQLLKQRR